MTAIVEASKLQSQKLLPPKKRCLLSEKDYKYCVSTGKWEAYILKKIYIFFGAYGLFQTSNKLFICGRTYLSRSLLAHLMAYDLSGEGSQLTPTSGGAGPMSSLLVDIAGVRTRQVTASTKYSLCTDKWSALPSLLATSSTLGGLRRT